MARNESAWLERRSDCRPPAAYPRRLAAPRSPAAHRSEAEDLLRDLAFVLRAARTVRRSMTRRDVP